MHDNDSRNDEPRPVNVGLGFRLGLAVCAGAALIAGAIGVLNLRLERSNLISIVHETADQTVETMRSSTRTAMMHNNPEDLRRILTTIGEQPGIHLIRVFDKRGRISHSTVPEEIGTYVDTGAEQCFACHEPDQPLDRIERQDRMRIFTDADGTRTLGVILPIRNDAACSDAACHAHDPSKQLLGVFDAHISLAPIDAHLSAAQRHLTLGILGTAVGVLALGLLLTWAMVLRPVGHLTAAATRVAKGDLSARVPSSGSHEIGRLASTWNEMLGELRRARNDLEEWGHTLAERVDEKAAELEATHKRLIQVERMASLGKLAAVVAHEINNPLAGINTYARLLQRKLGDTSESVGEARLDAEELDRILGMIETEAKRCGDIVRNLLLFSRTPAARFAPEKLPPLIERCLMLVRHQAELESVTLQTEIDDRLPQISCDAAQIEQLLLALIMNAIEATADSHGTVVVRARPADDTDGVVLTVTDDGRGIPPESIEKIFEPFFSTKEGGTGVGLGLAVVYGITNRHHGRIQVDSEPGAGTKFTVFLPREQPPGADSAPTGGVETI